MISLFVCYCVSCNCTALWSTLCFYKYIGSTLLVQLGINMIISMYKISFCMCMSASLIMRSFAGRQLVLETLYALTSNTKIITEAMNRGV